jgi:phage terminase Nu1 subunit (DNA packaging protein)
MKKTTTDKMTQAKLAGILGVSRQVIAHHQRSGKAPKLDDVEGWIEFIAATGREGTLPKELRKEIAKQRLRLIREQADRLQLENEVRRGSVVEFKAVHQFIRDLVSNCFFGELERIACEFPSAFKGRTEVEIHAECLRQIESIKKALEKKLAAMEKMSTPAQS